MAIDWKGLRAISGSVLSNPRLTYEYSRYNPTTKKVETHRYGIVPYASYPKASTNKGVKVTLDTTRGGYSGTTDGEDGQQTSGDYYLDPSKIIYNGQIYGEIYGGNGSGMPRLSDPRATAEYQSESKKIGIDPFATASEGNKATYTENMTILSSTGASRYTWGATSTAARIFASGPMYINSVGGDNGHVILKDKDESEFMGHDGMQVSEPSGEFQFNVKGQDKDEYSLEFIDVKPAYLIFPSQIAPSGTIHHIGPIRFNISWDPMETDINADVYDGESGKWMFNFKVTGCAGITGKKDGYMEWDESQMDRSKETNKFVGGFKIKFSDHISRWAHVKLSNASHLNTGDTNGVYATQSFGGDKTFYGGVPYSDKEEGEEGSKVRIPGIVRWTGKVDEYQKTCWNGEHIVEMEPRWENLKRIAQYINWGYDGNIKATRQPKYKGVGGDTANIYNYIVRFRGTGSNYMDWNGNIKSRDGKSYFVYNGDQVAVFESDNLSQVGFARDPNTDDIYYIHNGSDILWLNKTYNKVYRAYHFNECCVYCCNGNLEQYFPIPGYEHLETNDDGYVNISGADPGVVEGHKCSGWRLKKASGAVVKDYPVTTTMIPIRGDGCKIYPIFASVPISISEYQAIGYDSSTGREVYPDDDKPSRVISAKSEEWTVIDNVKPLGQGYECYFPIGWYTGKHGTGQYISTQYNSKGQLIHKFSSSTKIYAHHILNTITGLKWGSISDSGKWTDPAEFTGKENVFFVGKGQTLKIGVKVLPDPNDQTYYGMITDIKVSNEMFIVGEAMMDGVINAQSAKQMFRSVTPNSTTKSSTLDYMVMTAYTNVGIKSQAFVFFVDRVSVTLNTDVSRGSGDTIASKPEDPITDRSDEGLTTYFRNHASRGPKDGDTLDDYDTPYHTIWIYHSEMADIGEGVKRHWVDMGSASTMVDTVLGRLSDVGKPKKYVFSNDRRVQCEFRGWCDAKGTMITDSEGKIIGSDKLFLKSTELFASWIRPEDFVETDLMVLQMPKSKGNDYSNLLQLKLMTPTKMELTNKPSVSTTAVPTQMAENAFTFDKNVTQTISLSFTRKSPENPDDSSSDPDRWTNALWMRKLISMQNRYQADTDGVKFLYLPMDCARRRYRYATEDTSTNSYYRYSYYGYRYPLVGKCTDKPDYTAKDTTVMPANPKLGETCYIKSIDQIAIYMMNDGKRQWCLLKGHDLTESHWDKGFLYTNAYGDQHYYLGRNAYISKITPTYSFGTPDLISFDITLEVGGLKENEKDVIEW